MKSKIICFFFLIPILTYSQEELMFIDGRAIMQTVDTINLTKDEIYAGAKKWITNSFKDPELAIVMDDKDLGLLKFSYIREYTLTKRTSFDFINIVTLEIKEGRYRFTFSDIAGYRYNIPLKEYLYKNDGTIIQQYLGLLDAVEEEGNNILNALRKKLLIKDEW